MKMNNYIKCRSILWDDFTLTGNNKQRSSLMFSSLFENKLLLSRLFSIYSRPIIKAGTSFQFFQGGHNFDKLSRGGDKIWKKVCVKTQKITIFKIREKTIAPSAPPPPKCRPCMKVCIIHCQCITNQRLF